MLVRRGDLIMRKVQQPIFSRIICNAQDVQMAFASPRSMRLWWHLILRLHGKPVGMTLAPEARSQCVADGFKFYAWLYRLLAAIFFLMVPLLAMLDMAISSHPSFYWAVSSFLAGIYLWCVSGLGYAGARDYRMGNHQGTSSLIAFMVMIIAFLSMFIGVVSVVAHHQAWLSDQANLALAGMLFSVGIGSYMIEIIYLATDRSASSSTNA